MEESTQVIDLTDHQQHHQYHYYQHHHHHHHRYHYHHHHHYHRGRTPSVGEIDDDECSTDSGCSSGGSLRSGGRLSRRDSNERLCRSSKSSPRTYCYPERLRRQTTRSQERLNTSVQRSSERIWSLSEDVRSLPRGSTSPSSYSSSPSDAHSSSDSDSLKRSSTAETLRRAFQNLKITSSKLDNNKGKKHAKRSPKTILRSPVHYIYVRGPSGLPTQRIPRNSVFQQKTIHSRSYQDL
ncbi:hypothetical protein ALC56_05050 [Trachymyrmex septentrionalis]|uniref:DUF4797 domain-containing protein n=1 Tax=Trachymyrmex septentrionalis TaxID=34720 RepID=A0A195FL74_9HYME|nr:PREDICTED: SKI/DACH domain-containing protein 1-like [Trachymyrmex septentrionalis]KYN40739.1 hypothetical protein ALC56_05050 [Trachymyrmex septentrionalis]